MKLEITRHGEAVELRLVKDDGKITVWLCDCEQTALYKLANLLFSTPESDKQLKRSILVGEFSKKDAEPERPDMSKIAEEIKKAIQKEGFAPWGEDLSAPATPYNPYTVPYVGKPFIQPLQPYTSPNTGGIGVTPNAPYIGDPLPWGTQIYTSDATFIPCSLGKSLGSPDVKFKASGEALALQEEVVETTFSGANSNVTFIKVSMGNA